MLYCATSNDVCFCTTWQTEKHENCIFSLKCCISALPEVNQSLLDFFSLFDSRLMLTLLYDSLNLVINAFGSSPIRGHSSGESKSKEPQQLDCVHAQRTCTNALSS